MKILQIGTIDKAGGAAQVSWDLKMELEKRGHFVSMFVSDRVSDDKNVFKIPPTFPKQQIVSRVLANGIDTSIFRQHNKQDCRQELGWPEDKKIILFLASGGNADPRKGWQYTQDLVETITDKQSFLFICVGGKQEDKTRDNLWFIPKSRNRNLLAKYFSASDVFLFPSLADNFPLTVLESMACGLPVVGFDTGGGTEEGEHLKTRYVAKKKNIDDLL